MTIELLIIAAPFAPLSPPTTSPSRRRRIVRRSEEKNIAIEKSINTYNIPWITGRLGNSFHKAQLSYYGRKETKRCYGETFPKKPSIITFLPTNPISI